MTLQSHKIMVWGLLMLETHISEQFDPYRYKVVEYGRSYTALVISRQGAASIPENDGFTRTCTPDCSLLQPPVLEAAPIRQQTVEGVCLAYSKRSRVDNDCASVSLDWWTPLTAERVACV
jgi:hypothetical protein